MALPVLVLVISFIALILINVPVAFCMGIASVLAIMAMETFLLCGSSSF